MKATRTSASSAGVLSPGESLVKVAWYWLLSYYDEIVCCDFEFNGGVGLEPVDPADNQGNVPNVVCGVFWELRSGTKKRFWQGEFPSKPPPFSTGPRTLWLGFMSSAEWGSFLSLGWSLPEHILDPFVEFKNCTNRTGVKKKGKHKTKGEFENPLRLSMTETNCAKWRRESVPVGLREKGCEAPIYFHASMPIHILVARSPSFGVFGCWLRS